MGLEALTNVGHRKGQGVLGRWAAEQGMRGVAGGLRPAGLWTAWNFKPLSSNQNRGNEVMKAPKPAESWGTGDQAPASIRAVGLLVLKVETALS